jgi:hypothetical protein
MLPVTPFRTAALVGLLVSLSVGEARADARECVRSHAAGQDAVHEAKLSQARQKFLSCAIAECPAEVRDDCMRLAQDVDNRIPSVVFVVSDASGADVVDADVFVNGTKVADRIDGRPIRLDPGIVEFRVQSGAKTVNSRVVIREGEKNRLIVFRFDTPAAKPPKRDAPEPGGDTQPSSGGIPTAAWIAGGVGVIALGGFGYFAIAGRNKESDLDRCSPYCTQDEYDRMKRSYLFADIALGVGVLAFGTATVLVLTSPRSERTASVGVSLTRGGAGLGLHGSL